jgi:signal transduction histidine kinase
MTAAMSILKQFKPKFWDHQDIASGRQESPFSFRRKWKLLVFLTTLVAVTPLAVQTILGHRLTTGAIVNEIRQHTYSLVSNTTRTISLLMNEGRSMAAMKELLDRLEIGEHGDAFIVDQERRLLTASRIYGEAASNLALPLPEKSGRTVVFEALDPKLGPLVIGHAAIPDTALDLVITRSKNELMADWQKSRHRLVAFLAINIVMIVLMVLGMATYVVNRIHKADAQRVVALHRAEYANKVASLSRLSAGVAHEVNNPLAIIGEKVGLSKDLLAYPLDASRHQRLTGLLDDAIAAVKRCGTITQRLLNFARHMETRFEIVNVGEIVRETLSFLQKEAEYRCIGIFVDIDDEVPKVESGRGNLQQIFLNLINNAFAAVEDGGRLDIEVKMQGPQAIAISFADNGCGIPEKDLPHVFEPFFSSDTVYGGTGLGLSVTYGLVRELDGTITVESRVDEGTRFTVELPLNPQKKKRRDVCEYY